MSSSSHVKESDDPKPCEIDDATLRPEHAGDRSEQAYSHSQ